MIFLYSHIPLWWKCFNKWSISESVLFVKLKKIKQRKSWKLSTRIYFSHKVSSMKNEKLLNCLSHIDFKKCNESVSENFIIIKQMSDESFSKA
jgi:hypothetical protein